LFFISSDSEPGLIPVIHKRLRGQGGKERSGEEVRDGMVKEGGNVGIR
jgi:hypothetical protein